MTVSEALDYVTLLVDSYPPRTMPLTDGYIAALAAALATYPRAVAARCCDPAHGIARECKFLPTVADIDAYCERETAPLRRIAHRHDEARRQIEQAQHNADRAADLALHRAVRPTYDELKRQYGDDWGIAPGGPDQAKDRALHIETIAAANRTLFDRECARAGLDPAQGCSPALLQALKAREGKGAEG